MSVYNSSYYSETYQKAYRDLRTSTKWMSIYFLIVSDLVPFLDKYKNKKVFEIGCSWGGFIENLNINGFKNIIYSDMDNIVAEKYKKSLINFDLTNLKNLDVEKLKSDVIFAFDVLEHIEDSEIVVKNIHKLLNSDGLFIFSVPYPFKKHLKDPFHTNMQYSNFYTNLFLRNGFVLEDFKEVSLVPFTWKIGFPLYLNFVLKNRYFISETFYCFKKND